MVQEGIVIRIIRSLKQLKRKIVIALALVHDKIYKIGMEFFHQFLPLLLEIKCLVNHLPHIGGHPVAVRQEAKKGIPGFHTGIQIEAELILQDFLPALQIQSMGKRKINLLHLIHPEFQRSLRRFLKSLRLFCISSGRLIGFPQTFKSFRIVFRVYLYQKTPIGILYGLFILCLLDLQYGKTDLFVHGIPSLSALDFCLFISIAQNQEIVNEKCNHSLLPVSSDRRSLKNRFFSCRKFRGNRG